MDETQNSRVSDAAATRKRRSSILKSQRAPRTPFSELEFNVATPPDNAKSRRVSFSKRMGVAEFATNEATTTWKNFYEEQNKSLESSGNESGANVVRPSISHIGKRIFDQQFEEVEAVDFGNALISGNPRAPDFNLSINNVNLTEKLAAFECTDDNIPTAPQQRFEFSSLTDQQSKVFCDDFTIRGVGEVTNQINVNFSLMDPMSSNSKCDDLDEIQRDLQRSHNVVCSGPFRDDNMSEYIEVDLNMTHVAISNDVSDMSITDTVRNPKVDMSKNSSCINKSKIPVVDEDWITDKENIAVVNPYVTPPESDNFAINEVPDQVLVFDGKRLTVQSERQETKTKSGENRTDEERYRQTLLTGAPSETAPQRKTIVLNVNDDLPNFIDDPLHLHCQNLSSVNAQKVKQAILFDEEDVSLTQAVPNIIEVISNRNIIDCEYTMGDMALTQSVPSKIIEQNAALDKIQTVHYEKDKIIMALDDQHMSTTQVVGVVAENLKMSENLENPATIPVHLEKPSNKTMLFEESIGNISMTRVLPANIITSENKLVQNKRKTIVFESEDGNMSMTQAIPNKLLLSKETQVVAETNKRKTIVFDNDDGNMSMTQAIPNKLLLTGINQEDIEPNKRTTIVFESDCDNMSITQFIPNLLVPTEKSQVGSEVNKRKTIVFENDDGNMSITQAIPNNFIRSEKIIVDSEPNKRKTIVFEDDDGNMSITEAIPNILVPTEQSQVANEVNKRKTIVFENDEGNMSITQAIPNNFIRPEKMNVDSEPNKRKTIVFEDDDGNMSITQAIPNILAPTEKSQVGNDVYKRRTIIFESDDGNMSITQSIPKKLIQTEKEQEGAEQNKRKTILFEDDGGNMSITQAIPNRFPVNERTQIATKTSKNKISVTENNDNSMTEATTSNSMITEKTDGIKLHTALTRELLTEPVVPIAADTVNDSESQNSMLNESGALKKYGAEFQTSINISRKKEEFHKNILSQNEDAEVTMPQALPVYNLSTSQITQTDKRKTDFKNEVGNISSKKIFSKEVEDVVSQSIIFQDNFNTQDVNNVIVLSKNIDTHKMDDNKSINEIHHNISLHIKQAKEVIEIRQTDVGQLSFIKPIPDDLCDIDKEISKAEMDKLANLTQFGEKTLLQESLDDRSNGDILVYQATTQDTSTILVKTGSALQKQSNVSIGIQNVDSTSLKSSVAAVSVDTENDVKDIELQTNLQQTEEKSHIENEKVKFVETVNRQKSILDQLLDMSNSSVDNIVDKPVTTKIESYSFDDKMNNQLGQNSHDRIFIITKDNDDKADDYVNKLSENSVSLDNIEKLDMIENRSLPALELRTENNNSNLIPEINEIKQSLTKEQNNTVQNRHYEKVVSSDLQAGSDKVANKPEDLMKTRKSFKEADDTKELLEMLSDFTDRKSCVPIKEEGEDLLKTSRRSMALEYKNEIPEPRHISFAPKRQSIVLTREELLNNISMVQATFHHSGSDEDDSELDETVTESPSEVHESVASPKKTVRMSSDVVKTLHFEDESYSDASLKSEVKISPLKKTAFGETSYMKESKVNVIPTYLKDLSENIKALMNDLVKPRPDQMPFETALTRARKEPSTCSTQIQANLITSSQIDLDVGLHSNINSVYDLTKTESLEADAMENRAISKALKGHVTTASLDQSEMDELDESHARKYKNTSLKKPSQGPVLVFDHNNPLNNIMLAPPVDYMDVHKYNPAQSSEALCAQGNLNNANRIENQSEVHRVVTQYNVEGHIDLQSGDACSDKKGDSHSLVSDPSKPLSMDRSTEGIAMEVRDTEVNTLIVMKGNKELLEASSSLTLVDDALNQSAFEIKVETRQKDLNSPVRVIYKIDDEDAPMLENMDSDFVSNDDEPMEYTTDRKRSYSPTKRDETRPPTMSSPDVTPKPAIKIQKISNSPAAHRSKVRRVPEDSDKTDSNSDKNEHRESQKKRSPRKAKCSSKYKKAGTDLTVQQLITEYKITKMDQDMIERQIIETMQEKASESGTILPETVQSVSIRSPDPVSSFTSSRGLAEGSVKETVSYVGSQPSRVDWRPALAPGPSPPPTECDSDVNVVAKIDMLPFMGSRECEWENSGGDTWVFRLLRSRLRLRVRLAHRHHNALRTRVRADTPVAEISVDTVHAEEKDPLAALCVRFAAEAMRYECGRGCARAGDVPLALRRCAGVARVALRWARAMQDAHLRLAYTLTPDGVLTLKVANIPLRSVWEVTMRLELVVEDAREAAWPRAADVRVASVIADCKVAAGEVARALQPLSHDWGHAPRTVWKIFRYLKNKTKDDDLLGLINS